MIYYFTGQPGAGKTTIGKKLLSYFKGQYMNVLQIDGDEIRDVFNNKDYSEDGRRKNIQRAHDIAIFLDSKGYNVIITLVSPYRDLRDELKNKCKVKEIYVHCSDIRGKEKYHIENYEEPLKNFIDLDTTKSGSTTSFHKLLKKI